MQAANPSIRINSGYRTHTQQANLYAMKGGRGVARPGHSPHQLGKAADVGPPSQLGWIAANAPAYGLNVDSSEPWHIQAGDPATSAGNITGAQVVSTAESYRGVQYLWGGTSPSGFDCSGLVQYVYAKLGINLPRTSQAQASQGTAVGGLSQAQPGDLLFYNYEGPNSHVAIYIGNNQQVAAPHTGTVVQIQSVDTGSLTGIRRIVGGGPGQAAANTAKQATGTASKDSHGGGGGGGKGGGSSPGLAGSSAFIAGLKGGGMFGGVAGAGPAGGGGGGGTAAAGGSSGSGSTGTGGGPTPTGTLSASQVYQLAIGAGLSPDAARTATAVAKVESGFRTGARGGPNSDGTYDYGLWQKNSGGGGGPQDFNAQRAAQDMAAQSSKGTNWGAWGPDFGESGYSTNPPLSGLSGSKIAGALASLGPLGDPASNSFFTARGTGTGAGRSRVSRTMAGGGAVNVTIGPIYVQGTQSDAQNIANLVAAAIKGNQDIQTVGMS
jgi:cell wall-associated NlpC family hydrolase